MGLGQRFVTVIMKMYTKALGSLLLVEFPDLGKDFVEILDHAAMVHQDLSLAVRNNHERGPAGPEGYVNVMLLVGEQREGNTKL